MTQILTANDPARLVFDKDGDVDTQTMEALIDAVRVNAITDLVVFSYGWNNDEAAAKSLYGSWFGLLADQADPHRAIGYVGIRWPAARPARSKPARSSTWMPPTSSSRATHPRVPTATSSTLRSRGWSPRPVASRRHSPIRSRALRRCRPGSRRQRHCHVI